MVITVHENIAENVCFFSLPMVCFLTLLDLPGMELPLRKMRNKVHRCDELSRILRTKCLMAVDYDRKLSQIPKLEVVEEQSVRKTEWEITIPESESKQSRKRQWISK